MMYEDGFNIEEWKAKKLAERQETFAAQEEALKDVFASGQTLANYFTNAAGWAVTSLPGIRH